MVADLSCSVPRGESLDRLEPSGAGETTMRAVPSMRYCPLGLAPGLLRGIWWRMRARLTADVEDLIWYRLHSSSTSWRRMDMMSHQF